MKEFKIKQTKNYKMFQKIKSNRDLRPTNVSRLMESIKKIGLSPYKPIIVDKDFRVIDGQNRLEACKRLNIPIYYVQSNHSELDIPVLNSNQEKWKTEDYFKYYAELGYTNYKLMLEVVGKCHATISGVMAALDCRDNEAIKNGSYTFTGDSDVLARIVEDRLDFCKLIRHKKGISRKICIALNYMFRVKTFDYALLKKKMIARPQLVHTCDSVQDYIDMFREVYNYKSRNKIAREDIKRYVD